MFIYGIQNTDTGKWYIGRTIQSLDSRWKRHLYLLKKGTHPNNHLQSSVNKHGINIFKFVPLGQARHKIELSELEKCFIGFYNSFDDGYNLTLGGDGSFGCKPSLESRKKMSNAKKGKSSWNRGKKLSTEHRKKIANAQKNMSPENRLRITTGNKLSFENGRVSSFKGKRHTKESRIKISIARNLTPLVSGEQYEL